MSCDLTGNLLHAYFDGELDAARAAEFERHLEQCPECVEALEALERQRATLQTAALREMAPDALRKKLRAELRPEPPAVIVPRRLAWRWPAAG